MPLLGAIVGGSTKLVSIGGDLGYALPNTVAEATGDQGAKGPEDIGDNVKEKDTKEPTPTVGSGLDLSFTSCAPHPTESESYSDEELVGRAIAYLASKGFTVSLY